MGRTCQWQEGGTRKARIVCRCRPRNMQQRRDEALRVGSRAWKVGLTGGQISSRQYSSERQRNLLPVPAQGVGELCSRGFRESRRSRPGNVGDVRLLVRRKGLLTGNGGDDRTSRLKKRSPALNYDGWLSRSRTLHRRIWNTPQQHLGCCIVCRLSRPQLAQLVVAGVDFNVEAAGRYR